MNGEQKPKYLLREHGDPDIAQDWINEKADEGYVLHTLVPLTFSLGDGMYHYAVVMVRKETENE